jgi:large subunit ribosomal protein L5
MSITKTNYQDNVISSLKDDLGVKSSMAVPKITKVTVNMGLGPDALNNRKSVDDAIADLELIAGQKPIKTVARKSVASFKVREGFPIGCKVTLRGNRMYEFLDRLLSIAIPRERDFRGLNPKSFDGQGNYSLGIKEHIIFPEIDYDKVEKIRGMDICITTSANNDSEGFALLSKLNFPFKS